MELVKSVEKENDMSNSFQYMAIPRDAYLYIPKGTEIIEFNPKHPTKTLRRIFEGDVEYNQYERKKLQELQQKIENSNLNSNKSKKIKFPQAWNEAFSLRFLQANEYNIDKTIDMIERHIEWREKSLPIRCTDQLIEVLNIGFMYINGRDSRFRPIMVVTPAIFDKNVKKYPLECWVNSIVYLLEYVINNLLIPGQVENWDIIVDIKDHSISLSADMEKLMKYMQDNYRCRLYVMYIVNVSGFISFLWMIAKMVLDSATQKKIKIIKSNAMKDLFTFISPNQVEKKFGGITENITGNYFPPRAQSDMVYMQCKDREDILLKEDAYLSLIERNPLMTPSPYIIKLLSEKGNPNPEIEIKKTQSIKESVDKDNDSHSHISNDSAEGKDERFADVRRNLLGQLEKEIVNKGGTQPILSYLQRRNQTDLNDIKIEKHFESSRRIKAQTKQKLSMQKLLDKKINKSPIQLTGHGIIQQNCIANCKEKNENNSKKHNITRNTFVSSEENNILSTKKKYEEIKDFKVLVDDNTNFKHKSCMEELHTHCYIF